MNDFFLNPKVWKGLKVWVFTPDSSGIFSGFWLNVPIEKELYEPEKYKCIAGIWMVKCAGVWVQVLIIIYASS